jgi:hypothetical protein
MTAGRGASAALDDADAADRVQGAAAALSGGDLELEDLLRRGSDGGMGSMGGDGGLPETQLLALAQRQAERDRELAAAHRCAAYIADVSCFLTSALPLHLASTLTHTVFTV